MKFPAKFLSLHFVGPERSRKIPAKFLAENSPDELLQERREKDSGGSWGMQAKLGESCPNTLFLLRDSMTMC